MPPHVGPKPHQKAQARPAEAVLIEARHRCATTPHRARPCTSRGAPHACLPRVGSTVARPARPARLRAREQIAVHAQPHRAGVHVLLCSTLIRCAALRSRLTQRPRPCNPQPRPAACKPRSRPQAPLVRAWPIERRPRGSQLPMAAPLTRRPPEPRVAGRHATAPKRVCNSELFSHQCKQLCKRWQGCQLHPLGARRHRCLGRWRGRTLFGTRALVSGLSQCKAGNAHSEISKGTGSWLRGRCWRSRLHACTRAPPSTRLCRCREAPTRTPRRAGEPQGEHSLARAPGTAAAEAMAVLLQARARDCGARNPASQRPKH